MVLSKLECNMYLHIRNYHNILWRKKSVKIRTLLVKDEYNRIGYLKETISKIFEINFC